MSAKIDEFLDLATELAEDAKEGQRIKEAASKGHVKTEQYYREPAPGYDGELREMASQFVFGVWNEERRACSLNEIWRGVCARIRQRQADNDWPKIWVAPIKRTMDRRVNEAADVRFSEDGVTTPIICTKAGWYQANPALFEETVKKEIVK